MSNCFEELSRFFIEGVADYGERERWKRCLKKCSDDINTTSIEPSLYYVCLWTDLGLIVSLRKNNHSARQTQIFSPKFLAFLIA